MEVGEWGIGNFDYLSGNILDMEKKASYIVYYSSGEYDDYKEVCIFVTESKNKAVRYAQKFNRILKKWKLYFANFEKTLEFLGMTTKNMGSLITTDGIK